MARKLIVVADDQQGIRRLLAEVLDRDKFVLLEAGSGEEVIEIMGQMSVDLFLLDVKMPRLDGVAALGKILEQPDHPPVVMMTAQGEPDLGKRVLRMGATAYLEKPFDIDAFILLVDELINKGDEK